MIAFPSASSPSPYVGEDPVLVARRLAGLNPDGSQPASLSIAQLNKNLLAINPVEVNRIALLSKPVTVSPQLAALSSVASAPAVVSSAPLSGPVANMTPSVAALPFAGSPDAATPVPYSGSSGIPSPLNAFLKPRLSSLSPSFEPPPAQGTKAAAQGVGPRSSLFPSWLVTTQTKTPATANASSAIALRQVGTESGTVGKNGGLVLLALAALGAYIALR